MKQQIQYCTTSDGVRIAFAATGEGTPIVRHHRLVRYDPRGEGMSQREVAEISFEAWLNWLIKAVLLVGA